MWALLMIIIGMLTFGVSVLVFPFIYNKLYIKKLVNKGYVHNDDFAKHELARLGIIVQE